MRVHLLLPLGGTLGGGDPATIVNWAQRAEGAGIDGVVLAEHVVMAPDVSAYAWGRFPLEPSDPFLEPICLMSAIAYATRRITIGTGILIAGLRPAALLAKQLATLDHLAGPDRLEIGVGTGWHRQELEALGVDYERRGQVLTDTVRACRELWGDQPATVDTSSFSFGPVHCAPKPRSPGGPAILFAGSLTERTLDRVVELGDGWIPIMGATPEAVAADVARLRTALADAGRSGDDLRVRVPLAVRREDGALSLEATLAGARDDVWPGVTDCTIPIAAFVRSEHDVGPFFTQLAQLLDHHRTLERTR